MNPARRPGRYHFQTELPNPQGLRRHRFNPWNAVAAISVAVWGFIAAQASAQNYALSWHTIAGGGGTSSNGQYVVNGTIGQHDAGGTMTGGSYSLTGGFWTFTAAVQTPGAPQLNITQNGPNSVLVWWLANGTSFKLQTNSTLSPTSWVNYGSAIASNGGTNSVAFSPPRGNLFFRLSFP